MRSLRIRTATGIALVGALALGACSSPGSPSPSGTPGTAGASSGAAGSASGAGTGGAGTGGGAGTSGAGTGGVAGAASGTGGAQGTAGAVAGNGGTGGTTAGGGGATGAGGSAGGGVAGGGGSGGGAAPLTKMLPSGPSAGCGVAPPTQDKSSGFTIHPLMVPACGTGAVTSKCVTADFAPGGKASQTNGAYDFVHRNYAVQLPTNYDDTKAYPIIIGGGGCGGGPTESGGGFTAGQGAADAIRIGMSYVNMCFADGGDSCATGNHPLCVNTPEVPYFYALLADVESKYCVEKSKVYVGGYSSGGWETLTLGCAASDVIAGIVSVNGGLRNHRPTCTGPIATLMVTGAADTDNPVGPLVMDMAYAPAMLSAATVNLDIASLDSNGSAPARDAILARNGCVGTDTAAYDPAYPLCMKYTGCPAASPVVWCSVTGSGHQGLSYQGVTYYPSTGAASLQWNFLTKLP
jgi:poly(3-hydroxybutyrate) depolymerase